MLKRIREMQEQDGFTLIELMVVVLIIAILIAIAIPTFLGLRQRAQDRSAQSNLRNGLTAAKAFYTDGETYTNFDNTDGEAIEPSLAWTAAASPAEGEVKVLAASGDVVRLITLSASGDVFCLADNAGANEYGGGGTYAAVSADCDNAAWT